MVVCFLTASVLQLFAVRVAALSSADDVASLGSCDAGTHGCSAHTSKARGGEEDSSGRHDDINTAPRPVTAKHEYCIIGAG